MSGSEKGGRRLRLPAFALAALLVVAGALALVVGLHSQQSAPQPPASAAVQAPASTAPVPAPPPTATPGSTDGAAPTPPSRGLLLPASIPTHVDVPAIGVSSDLLQLGLQPDNTVEVPPLAKDSRAGWFRGSPTPGQLGPAVILGHVDSAEYGPGVFFKLGNLRPGDPITVTRSDGTAAVFTVDRVVRYPKDAFPTLAVYGNTDHAALRLITCGGRFDSSTRNYVDNIVVYASLTASHAA